MAFGLDLKYLMSVDVWTQYGYVNKNVDPKKLNPIILAVQHTRVRKLLGTQLYNKLITDTPTFTGLYQTLMNDYLLLLMVAYCDYEYTWHGTNQMTNKGVGTLNDDHLRANGTDQNNDLRDNIARIIRERERDLIGWLKDNWNDIPELNTSDSDTCHQDLKPAKEPIRNWGVI